MLTNIDQGSTNCTTRLGQLTSEENCSCSACAAQTMFCQSKLFRLKII